MTDSLKAEVERRMEHLTTHFVVDIRSSCWKFTGQGRANGYGTFYDRGTMHRAHRVSYEVFKGPIPSGLELDHLCRNKLCVNPDHLEAVTHRENVLRGTSPVAVLSKHDICQQGHPLQPMRVFPNARRARRWCPICYRASKRRRYDPEKRQARWRNGVS